MDTAVTSITWQLQALQDEAERTVWGSQNNGFRLLDGLDKKCAEIANLVSEFHPIQKRVVGFDKPANIYLVTELYAAGGHRNLLQQMVESLPNERHIALFTRPHTPDSFSFQHLKDLGVFVVAPNKISDLLARVLWLREKLCSLAAHRIFYLHHPDDAVASVSLLSCTSNLPCHRYFVRHSDIVPSLCSDLPGVVHLAIRRKQKEMLRANRDLIVADLPLSVGANSCFPYGEDRLHFFAGARLTTATCGNPRKFHDGGEFVLPQLIATLLRNPFQKHIHVGGLTSEQVSEINKTLDDNGIERERLCLAGEVENVAEYLAVQRVDIFISSFPVGGSLTVTECVSIGLPIAMYSPPESEEWKRYLAGSEHAPPVCIKWGSPEELLRKCRDVTLDQLKSMSRSSQLWFESRLTKAKFQRRFMAIIAAVEGRRAAPTTGLVEAISEIFSHDFYDANNPDVSASGIDGLQHFVLHGHSESRQPCLLFAPSYYITQLPEEEKKFAARSPITHYLTFGERRGFAPHPFFSPDTFKLSLRSTAPDVKPRGSLLGLYLDSRVLLQPHTFFDPDYYLRQVASLDGQSPLEHFLTSGYQAHKDPHPLINLDRLGGIQGAILYIVDGPMQSASPHILFDDAHYRQYRSDFQLAAGCPLWAYVIEGNNFSVEPNPIIRPEFAQRHYSKLEYVAKTLVELLVSGEIEINVHPLIDVAYIKSQLRNFNSSGMSVVATFLERGRLVDPHPYFNTEFYIAKNEDIYNSDIVPLLHYIRHGDLEYRQPNPWFNTGFYRERLPAAERHLTALEHYVLTGARYFLECQHLDNGYKKLTSKMATHLFSAGQGKSAALLLLDTLHSEWAPKHSHLATSALPLESSFDRMHSIAAHTFFPRVEVRVTRPAISANAKPDAPGGRYSAPPALVRILRKATIIAGNDGVLHEGKWFDSSLEGFDPECMHVKGSGAVYAVSQDDVLIRYYRSHRYLKAAIFACGTYSRNYFHFLFEVLPRAAAAESMAPLDVPIVTDGGMPVQHYQALKLLFPTREIIQLDPQTEYEVGTLYVASAPCLVHDAFGSDRAPADSVRYHPAVVDYLNGASFPFHTGATSRKLFLRRDGAYRKLLNIDELQERLVKLGYEVIDCELLSFSEQVSLFSQASSIVAPTGAHLANIVFCRPGTSIFPLFSDAPATNFYLWSKLGEMIDLKVVNIVGKRSYKAEGPGLPAAHDDYRVSWDRIGPLVGDIGLEYTIEEPLEVILDSICDAGEVSEAITSSWNYVADSKTPCDYRALLLRLRQRAMELIHKEEDLTSALRHRYFSSGFRDMRSGLLLYEDPSVDRAELRSRLGELFSSSPVGDGDTRIRLLMCAMLTFQAWQLPIVGDLEALPAPSRSIYLSWLLAPPFLSSDDDEVRFRDFAKAKLTFLTRLMQKGQAEQSLVEHVIRRVDLSTFLLRDIDFDDVIPLRNALVDCVLPISLRSNPVAALSGKRRLGILFRTFRKGPDSEAAIAAIRALDRSRWEVHGYSLGYVDSATEHDSNFDFILDGLFTARHSLPFDCVKIRSQLIHDNLDVFVLATALTFGIGELELALYERVAPVQIELNSHLPHTSGLPSFDFFITGGQSSSNEAVGARVKTISVPGPVINYLSPLEPNDAGSITRETLGISDATLVLLCGGSLAKLSYECMKTLMQSAMSVPDAVLVLAPYNPGWSGTSLAFAFNEALSKVALEIHFDLRKLIVLGELSLAETRSALRLADLYLSPFPHGGATMLRLSLSEHTPVVVMRRKSTRSIDEFMLEACGLGAMIAENAADYVALVRKFGQDVVFRREMQKIAESNVDAVLTVDDGFSRKMAEVIEELAAKNHAQDPV